MQEQWAKNVIFILGSAHSWRQDTKTKKVSRCLAPHKEGQSVLWAKKEKLAGRLKRERDFLFCILFFQPSVNKEKVRRGGLSG